MDQPYIGLGTVNQEVSPINPRSVQGMSREFTCGAFSAKPGGAHWSQLRRDGRTWLPHHRDQSATLSSDECELIDRSQWQPHWCVMEANPERGPKSGVSQRISFDRGLQTSYLSIFDAAIFWICTAVLIDVCYVEVRGPGEVR